MPAGVSWGQYLKFTTCAMLSMMAGSQLVHMYYKPLEDLNFYIEKEMEHAHLATDGGVGNVAADKSKQILKTT